VPNDCSDEPKYVAHCCVALKCCVLTVHFFVFQLHLQQWVESEYSNTKSMKNHTRSLTAVPAHWCQKGPT